MSQASPTLRSARSYPPHVPEDLSLLALCSRLRRWLRDPHRTKGTADAVVGLTQATWLNLYGSSGTEKRSRP